MSYAKAKYAFGFCDKTGFRYPLKDLVPEYNNGVKTGFLVGKDVVDPDQPQNFLGRLKINDPQSLRDPRPDRALLESRALYGFNPVGSQGTLMTASVGRVSVTTTEVETVTGASATGSVGSVTVSTTTGNVSVSVAGLAGTGTVGSVANVIADTFTVTVSNPGSGNRYYIDSVLQATLTLSEGQTYVFNWSAATSHPLRFSTTSDGTHTGGGSEYTTGVVKDDSAYTTTITVAASAPTLYYYCQFHSGMGGQLNTT